MNTAKHKLLIINNFNLVILIFILNLIPILKSQAANPWMGDQTVIDSQTTMGVQGGASFNAQPITTASPATIPLAADDPGAANHDAGVRAARDRPFGRVRRLQRRGGRAPGGRFGQPRDDLRRRVLAQRQARRPQGERRPGGADRRGRGAEGRQGAGGVAGAGAGSAGRTTAA